MQAPASSERDLNWRKARRSLNHGACVEVAGKGDGVRVRDTTNRRGAQVRYSAAAWREFTGRLQVG